MRRPLSGFREQLEQRLCHSHHGHVLHTSGLTGLRVHKLMGLVEASSESSKTDCDSTAQSMARDLSAMTPATRRQEPATPIVLRHASAYGAADDCGFMQ